MSDLVQAVKDGKVVSQTSSSSSSTSSTSKTSSSSLDKNSFLKLLCTQMQYQDPLNPSSNTEYVAQLATFSELEQMQNLATTSTNSQAFSLVGKNVTVTSDDSTSSNSTTISGTVDYVAISNGKAKLSIDGKLYSIDNLTSVTDEDYIKNQNSPGVASKTALTYDADSPKNVSFDVNMGSGDYAADKVAVAINGNKIDSNLVKAANGKVTIDQSALTNLENGTYNLTIAFNNSDYTTVSDKVTLQVNNSKVTNTSSTDNSSNSTDAVTT